jgi:hypothetical protein
MHHSADAIYGQKPADCRDQRPWTASASGQGVADWVGRTKCDGDDQRIVRRVCFVLLGCLSNFNTSRIRAASPAARLPGAHGLAGAPCVRLPLEV